MDLEPNNFLLGTCTMNRNQNPAAPIRLYIQTTDRAGLLKSRAAHETELMVLKSAIELHQKALDCSKMALVNLVEGIKRTKAAWTIYKTNLDAVNESLRRIAKITPGCTFGFNPPADLGYIDILRRANKLIQLGSSSEQTQLESQKSDLQSRILALGSALISLGQEQRNWEAERNYHQRELSAHLLSMDGAIAALSRLKDPLLPIRYIPAEIWIQIFQIGEAISAIHYESHETISLICKVSQVCRAWRDITMQAPQLWARIEIVPAPQWPHKILEGIKQMISRSHGGPLDVVVRLQPTKQRKWQGYPALLRPVSQLLAASVLSIKNEYSIHFYIATEDKINGPSILTMPFKRPSCITVQSLSPSASTALKSMIFPSHMLQKLILVNIWPKDAENFTESLLNLKYLRIDMATMGSFDLDGLLVPGLEELHILHPNSATFYKPRRIFTLSHLHTLAVTLHECLLCSMLDLPVLRTLTLYGSALLNPLEPALQLLNSRNILHLLKTLSFVGWSSEINLVSTKIITQIIVKHPVELYISRSMIDFRDLTLLLEGNPRIATVTLAYCTGITHAECQIIASKIMRLNIYV